VNRRALFAAAIVVIFALVLAVVAVLKPPPAPPILSDRFEIVTRDLGSGLESVVVSNLTDPREARFMPDESVVFSGTLDGRAGIWRTRGTGGPVLLWAGYTNSVDPSRDGSRVAFMKGGGIGILNVTTGAVDVIPNERLAPADYALFPCFDGTGRRILFAWHDPRQVTVERIDFVLVHDLMTNKTDVLLRIPGSHYDLSGLAFFPDGNHFVFALDGVFLHDIVLNLTVRLTGPANEAFPRVSALGGEIVFQALTQNDELGRPLYMIRLHRLNTGETVDVLPQEQYGGPHPDISENGRTIVYTRQPRLQ